MKSDKTALILIEFQNDFCKEGGKLNALVRDEIARNNTIANAVNLLDGAREKNIHIVHCPFVLDRTWSKERRFEGLVKGLTDGDVFAPGTWGVEIIDGLRMQMGAGGIAGNDLIGGFFRRYVRGRFRRNIRVFLRRGFGRLLRHGRIYANRQRQRHK